MKKILTAAVASLLFTSATMAQAVKKTEVKATESKMKVVPAKPATTAKVVPVTKPVVAAKPAASGAVVLKKDGTPDKRYNNAAKATGPVKKDGTPDMRYKKNKN